MKKRKTQHFIVTSSFYHFCRAINHGLIAYCLNSLLFSTQVGASTYYGRWSLGGNLARESFIDDTSGSTSNDFLNAMGRFFLHAQDLTKLDDEFTIDIRDRYDYFGALNESSLKLVPKNTLQLQRLFYKVKTEGFDYTVGRTSVMDAGGVYVDGLVLERRIEMNWSSGFFGGLNPKRHDQAYVIGNSDSSIFGAYLTYEPKFLPWGKNFILANGLVSEMVQNQEDRRFLYENLYYQWSPEGRLVGVVYLDFVPRVYVQTANFSWLQGWNPKFETNFSLLGIDVIEYTRRQGVREKLDASPYKEAQVRFRYLASNTLTLDFVGLAGKREADQLTKTDEYLQFSSNFSKNSNLRLRGGIRKNFTSDDYYGGLGYSFFSSIWELGLEGERSVEKHTDGVVLNGKSVELYLTILASKKLFLTGGLQYAGDENVNIISATGRINYRFGSSEVPPIRDGAPPNSRM